MDIILQALILLILFFVIFILYKILQSQLKCPYLSIVGKIARVTEDINPEGMIKCEGELWKAISEQDIKSNEYVIITKVFLQGRVRVRKI